MLHLRIFTIFSYNPSILCSISLHRMVRTQITKFYFGVEKMACYYDFIWRIINFSLSKHLRISRGRPTCTFSERLEAIEKIYLGFFNRVSTIAGIIFNSSLAHLKNLTVAYNWFKQRQLNLSPAASSFISNP